MIRINLLPEEYRRKARTPFKMLLAIAFTTLINGSLLATWSWMAFGIAAEVETERSTRQMEMDGLTPQIAYHDALTEEINIFASQEQTLAQINTNRVLWTKKLDEMIDIVNSGNEVEHFIWFDDLTVKQEPPRGNTMSFGSLKATGHSGSPKWNQVANFLQDVGDPQLTHFVDDFQKISMPEGTQNAPEDDLIPSINWSFPLTLDLRSPDERWAIQQQQGGPR